MDETAALKERAALNARVEAVAAHLDLASFAVYDPEASDWPRWYQEDVLDLVNRLIALGVEIDLKKAMKRVKVRAARARKAAPKLLHYYKADPAGFPLGPLCGAAIAHEDDWIPFGQEPEPPDSICFPCRRAAKAGAAVIDRPLR